jgi:hypothetical protein
MEAAGTVQGTPGELLGSGAVAASTVNSLLGTTTGNTMLNMAVGSAGGNAAAAAMTKLAASATAAGLSLGKLAGKAGMVGAAGAAGWMIGSAINDQITESSFGDSFNDTVGGGLNSLAAAFGNDAALESLELNRIDAPQVGRKYAQQASKTEVVNNITVNEDGSVDAETVIDGKQTMSEHQSSKRKRRRGPR